MILIFVAIAVNLWVVYFILKTNTHFIGTSRLYPLDDNICRLYNRLTTVEAIVGTLAIAVSLFIVIVVVVHWFITGSNPYPIPY